jgi:hypothetical protein
MILFFFHFLKGGGGHIFFANYTLNLPFIYPIFSSKKILFPILSFDALLLRQLLFHLWQKNLSFAPQIKYYMCANNICYTIQIIYLY